MPVNVHDLVDVFGESALTGNGAIFVGAGMSKTAGLPDWHALLSETRTRAQVPSQVKDAPLAAEYIANSLLVGREALHAHVLNALVNADTGTISKAHGLLSQLPVAEYWTTNYDQLIERACPHAQVLIHDHDVRNLSASRPTIVKLHGSITPGPPPRWVAPPVLTRTEFEQYEEQHPRMWALLRASYLSRTVLFLGFSFSDPNVEILQRLARRDGTYVTDRHLTVMRRPKPDQDPDGIEVRLHELKVADLERSGVLVCEINEYDEILQILQALVRRTRPPRLFISGSKPLNAVDGAKFREWCRHVSAGLSAEPEWQLASLGGNAGWEVTRAVARTQIEEDRYKPADLVFHFRHRNEAAPLLPDRLGTAVYSNLEREPLRTQVLGDCRTLLAIHGGRGTLEELEMAMRAGVSVVPLAASGGAAREFWVNHKHNRPLIGGQQPDDKAWDLLDSTELVTAVRAAHRLLRQGMYKRD